MSMKYLSQVQGAQVFRICESIPKSGGKLHFGNEQSISYSVFFAVFSRFVEYFHSLFSLPVTKQTKDLRPIISRLFLHMPMR